MTTVTPFLMFQGEAEAAMEIYVGLFGGSIDRLERYGDGVPGPAGKVYQGAFTVAGLTVRCFDSPVEHAFGFTPAISLFVDCQDEAQQERLYAALSEGGQVMMELADHGFSRRFGWVADRFGVSWQLNLP